MVCVRVCVEDVMDVDMSCIALHRSSTRRGAVGARVWEV